jgi:hypothetical protein
MVEYRRSKITGGAYFFTVNCAERKGIQTLTDNIELLRQRVGCGEERTASVEILMNRD